MALDKSGAVRLTMHNENLNVVLMSEDQILIRLADLADE